MTGHLKMLQSPRAMNNAEGAASRFPAQASKFIGTPPAPNPKLKPTPPQSPAGPGQTQLNITRINPSSHCAIWFLFCFLHVEEKKKPRRAIT